MKKINWLSILSKTCTFILLFIAFLIFGIGMLILYDAYREFLTILFTIACVVAVIKFDIMSLQQHRKELEEKERLKEMYETIQQMVEEEVKETEENEEFKFIDYK